MASFHPCSVLLLLLGLGGLLTKLMMEISKQASKKKMVFEVIPEDMILEILFRVPPISLLSFKSVCKKWYSLITNPDFLQIYHHHPQRLLDNSGLLLLSTLEQGTIILPPQTQTHQNQNQEQLKVFLDHALNLTVQNLSSSSPPPPPPPPRLIDSCNGLLLYRTQNPVSGTGGDITHYYAVNPIIKHSTFEYHVFNPITKQCLHLPIMDHFGKTFGRLHVCWAHIVFDPSVSLSFKLVMCFVFYGIYVYSTETSSWSCLKEAISCGWSDDDLFDIRGNSKAVLLDGMLYVYIYKDKLVCFDVIKDTIWFLLLPPRAMGHHKRNLLYFGECDGRLRLIERYSSTNSYKHQIVTLPFSFDIKELEDVPVGHDHSEIRNWTVKYRVNIEMSYEDHIPLTAQIIHIYRSGDAAKRKKKKKKGEEDEDEDEDEALLFLNVGRRAVISYDLTSNTFGKERKISDFDQSDGLHVFPYTPTLFTFS